MEPALWEWLTVFMFGVPETTLIYKYITIGVIPLMFLGVISVMFLWSNQNPVGKCYWNAMPLFYHSEMWEFKTYTKKKNLLIGKS